MLLSARMLENGGTVNDLEATQRLRFCEGDAPLVYFQLVDLTKDRSDRGYFPAGRRYVPATSSTLLVTLININDSHQVVRYATQPFPGDLSIWALQLIPADKLLGTVSLKFLLTETINSVPVITNGTLPAAIGIESATGLAVLPTTPDWRAY